MDSQKKSKELVDALNELALEKEARVKLEADLIIARKELAFQNMEKGKRATELGIANVELEFQEGEKKKRAAELIDSSEKSSQLIERLEDNINELLDYKYALDESSIVAITDKRGKILKVNDNFCKLSKFSEKELIGQDHRIISSGYHSKEFIRNLWQTITSGNIWKGELRNKAKDGTIYWVDTTIIPFLDQKGKPYQYLAIRQEITKRKNLEEKMLSKNEEMEQFFFISNHDLQEPLRKIETFSNLILQAKNHNLSELVKDYLRKMQLTAKQMRTLLEDLLSYWRTTASTHKIEETDLKLIIEELIKELKPIIEEKKATIVTTELGKAKVIPFKFHLLLHNLLSNALKFSQPNIPPHIIISSRIEKAIELNIEKLLTGKDYYHISIEDNGIGFDPKYKNHIFEIFQRLHTREEYEGTGMGLAIVKKIVENHNGLITATSELNKGTTFDIYIPA